jgi:hypothetical protein
MDEGKTAIRRERGMAIRRINEKNQKGIEDRSEEDTGMKQKVEMKKGDE